MNEQQKQYELNYWMAASRDKNTARQVKLAQLWAGMAQKDLPLVGLKVLEIGPGPYGGLLAMLWSKKVTWDATALDPLWPVYYAAGFETDWVNRTCCRLITKYEHLEPAKYNLVLCANVLDHGKADLSELKLVHDAMAPGGQLHFHLNLRTPEQCNEGHPVAITREQVIDKAMEAGFHPVKAVTYDRDPVEDSEYRTIVGIWERPL